MRNILFFFLLLLCTFSYQAFSQEGVLLRNAAEINTSELDFSAVPFGNGIIFTSSKSNRFLQCPPENAGDYTDVYFAPLNPDGNFGEKQVLQGEVNGKYNDGVATLGPGGSRMIFTRNNLDGKNAAEVIDLKLYAVENSEETWINSVPLPFNSDDWSTAHPALSHDGSLLFFSSNRPGSESGSMDIWYSRFENGAWSAPVNAGPGINSAGTELFPSFDEFNNLFFSSNGRGGKGGLDLFSAKWDPAAGYWESAQSLDSPFNQEGDDVSFFSMEGGTRGYYSGDRSGGTGKDDIYSWRYEPEIKEAVIVVTDKKTLKRLSGAKVEVKTVSFGSTLDRIYELNLNGDLRKFETDANGSVKVSVRRGCSYEVIASKEEYLTETRQESYEGLTAAPEYIIPLEKERHLAMLNIKVVDAVNMAPIPLSDLTIYNVTTGETLSHITDLQGAFVLEVDCSHTLKISASKDSWLKNTITWVGSNDKECMSGKTEVVVPLSQPKVVILEPIFFNFDRASIRSRDARASLDSLTRLLNRFTTLTISLEAHCDARGTDNYNAGLAARRASAARDFLMSKGISAARLSTQAFGERTPINNCRNKVYCPEPAHQLNRRVDVIPLSHAEPDVIFKTRDISQMQVQSDRK